MATHEDDMQWLDDDVQLINPEAPEDPIVEHWLKTGDHSKEVRFAVFEMNERFREPFDPKQN